jgi:hypothetical protein
MSKKCWGLKVLPLDWWMYDYDNDERYLEISPVLKRDGYYWARKFKYCWFESQGRAWRLNNGTQFKHEIDTYLAYPTMSVETAKRLLHEHRKNKFLSKAQLRKLQFVLHRRKLEEIRRGATLFIHKAKKSWVKEDM